jgi:hypothetical protein
MLLTEKKRRTIMDNKYQSENAIYTSLNLFIQSSSHPIIKLKDSNIILNIRDTIISSSLLDLQPTKIFFFYKKHIDL